LAYGRLAENRQTHLAKGQRVYAESRLKSCIYTTKDGQTRSSLDVTVSDVHFLGGKGADGQRSVKGVAETVSIDDLPIGRGLSLIISLYMKIGFC